MPIPKPRLGEKKKAFIGRCMSVVSKTDSLRPQSVQLGICYSSWNGAKGIKEVGCIMNRIKRIVERIKAEKSANPEIAKYIQLSKQLSSSDKKLREAAKMVLKDFEYLLHHIEIDAAGKEEIHHCLVYDHIGNLFEQAHILIKGGTAYMDGKKMKDGSFHVIKGLEPTQEVAWSDEEAKEGKIKPKKMKSGMTLKVKSKEW